MTPPPESQPGAAAKPEQTLPTSAQSADINLNTKF